MKLLIVISSPSDVENEHDLIHALFENGLECFHLRKPDKDKEAFESFLRKINLKYYKQIVIHSHYSLIEKYNLKGVHIPEKMLNVESVMVMVKPMKRYGFTISGSVHSIEQLNYNDFNYLFLSPVFDSISKEGYKSSIDLEEFKKSRTQKTSMSVIALGGIDAGNFEQAIQARFDGVALLGAIWNKPDGLNEFIKIKSGLAELSNL